MGMDEQEYRYQVRRRCAATLAMIAIGTGLLRAQGEPPGPGAAAIQAATVAGRAAPSVHPAAPGSAPGPAAVRVAAGARAARAPVAHVQEAIYRPFSGGSAAVMARPAISQP